MALPGLFPIYPDPIPMKYQVSLSLPPLPVSEISKVIGITGSSSFLVPNIDYLQKFIEGDIGIADKMAKETLLKNFNSPFAQNNEKIFKAYAKLNDIDIPDLNKYKDKVNGKIKFPKEEITAPNMGDIGLKAFEKTVMTSIFETQKPYFEIAKLVIGNVAKIEDIIARVMPLLGVPLKTKSLKPVGNNGVPNGRPKAIGYQNGAELKKALSKLQAISKTGSEIKIDKNGNVKRNPSAGGSSGTASVSGNAGVSDNWEIISTVYSTGKYIPGVDYRYTYIDLPAKTKKGEESVDLNLGDDDPYNKCKPEKIILGIFKSDGTPLNPSEKIKTISLNSNGQVVYLDTPFTKAGWILNSPKWQMDNIYPNRKNFLNTPSVPSVFPSFSSPIYKWKKGISTENSKTSPGSGWQIKTYSEGDKNLITGQDAITGDPVIVGFENNQVSDYKSFFTDGVKYKMNQVDDLEQTEKDQYTNDIINQLNIQSHLQNVFLYGQNKTSVYKQVNGKPAFPDSLKLAFKPFELYSDVAASDTKLSAYNKSQGKQVGYIWIDPEADYETKVIRVDPTTKIAFEEAKGAPQISSNIKSFVKNKVIFRISNGQKFNIDVQKNNLTVQSYIDVNQYVLENWNYNSNTALSPERRVENTNSYRVTIWSDIPTKDYVNKSGTVVIASEVNKNVLADIINGKNELVNVYQLVKSNNKWQYQRYRWLLSVHDVTTLSYIDLATPEILTDLLKIYENNSQAKYTFNVSTGVIIKNIDNLVKQSDVFNRKIKFSFKYLGVDYDLYLSLKDIIAKINKVLPEGDIRDGIISKLSKVSFPYTVELSKIFNKKEFIKLPDGVTILRDNKTRVNLKNGYITKWFYTFSKPFSSNSSNLSEVFPTFGKEKTMVLNYNSDLDSSSNMIINSSSVDIPLYQIKAENTNFPYGKIIDPSKITNEHLTKDELYSKGKYGHADGDNPQEIEVIQRYMLTDLDTESYYIIEGVLTEKNTQTDDVPAKGGGAVAPGGGYYRMPHALGSVKVFLSLVVDIVSKLIPKIVKLIALFKNPGSFIVEIIKEKLGESFSIFSGEAFKTFEKAKAIKDEIEKDAKSTADSKAKDAEAKAKEAGGKAGDKANSAKSKTSDKINKLKDTFKNSPLSNVVFVDKKGNYKFLLDGLAMLPFEIFGLNLPFGAELNFDNIPNTPIKLILDAKMAKVKNLQDFLTPKIKSFKNVPGGDGKIPAAKGKLAPGLNISDLKSANSPIYKQNNKIKLNPNDSDVVDIKYSTGQFINGIDYNYIYINQDEDKVLTAANNLLSTPNELIMTAADLDSAKKVLDDLKDALKKNPDNKALKDALNKLRGKLGSLADKTQPLLKMLLGFITIPIKIVGGIIEWLMNFFKSLTNPLTLPSKIIELLSFSWIMDIMSPVGLMKLIGIKFEPKKLAEWCALTHIPKPKMPEISPKIPEGFDLPSLKYYKDASPKGKFLIPDDFDIADLNQFFSAPFMPKLPVYTARQFRENCTRPLKLVLPTLCFFEKIINGIIDFIWSTLGIEALIPAPHIKLCSKSVDPDINDAIKLANDMNKTAEAPVNTGTFGDNNIPTDADFLYDITLDDGTVVKGLNYEEMQKYIKDHENIGYDFKF